MMVENFLRDVVPKYNAYGDFIKNPLTNSGKKIAIEELEPTQFQTSWISGYAGNYNQEGITNVINVESILRKLDDRGRRQWEAVFNRYPHWKHVVDQIPLAKDPETLLEKVKEMNNYFYPSHPVGHYPYL